LLPNGNIFAFALIEVNDKKNTLYVDVICSHRNIKYAGEKLLNEITRLCKTLMFSKIILKSVHSAIPFYEKYGFQKMADCDDESLCEMEKQV
jgi:predicted GNAT family N-acyltransferase